MDTPGPPFTSSLSLLASSLGFRNYSAVIAKRATIQYLPLTAEAFRLLRMVARRKRSPDQLTRDERSFRDILVVEDMTVVQNVGAVLCLILLNNRSFLGVATSFLRLLSQNIAWKNSSKDQNYISFRVKIFFCKS